jgi:hypothetical protein
MGNKQSASSALPTADAPRWGVEDRTAGVNITLNTLDASVKLTGNVDLRLTIHHLVIHVSSRVRSEGLDFEFFELFAGGAEERLVSSTTVGSLVGDVPGSSVTLFLLPVEYNSLSDRRALEALYSATSGPRWKNKRNWTTSAPLGDWHGVTVDEHGRVALLKLRKNNMNGVLPREIGWLTCATNIDVSDNRLTGKTLHSLC